MTMTLKISHIDPGADIPLEKVFWLTDVKSVERHRYEWFRSWEDVGASDLPPGTMTLASLPGEGQTPLASPKGLWLISVWVDGSDECKFFLAEKAYLLSASGETIDRVVP